MEELLQKEEEAKVDKNPIDDHYGDEESFEPELWNEEIESIKQKLLNGLGVVQETNMKEREPLNKINMNKKAKALIELRNLSTGSIIREICPDLTKRSEVL